MYKKQEKKLMLLAFAVAFILGLSLLGKMV